MATLAIVGLATLLTGCTAYSYTSRSAAIRSSEISSRSLGAEINVDFSRKVTATSDPQILKADAINDAQYKCINENNIDVVVDPIYKVEFNMFQKKAYKATVVGYAGTYKQVPTGVDAVVEKNYKVEDIEKYKLINDPTFYQYYYQKDPVQGGDVTNYFINSNGNGGAPIVTKSQPASIMLKSANSPLDKAAKVNTKVFDYNKSKKLRDAGIGMFSSGVVELGLIFPLMLCVNRYDDYDKYYYWDDAEYDKERNLYYEQWDASWFFCALGCSSIISGIPMWAVGSKRMKKASAPQLAIGGTKDGLGMRLTF
ncbi:MAG: hypothetical protein KBS40_05375 [Bacteroidales bacterium]|nr:hypothetical protein [Bacteroidales bacterium]